MARDFNVRNGIKLPFSSLPSGTGDNILTVDSTTGEVGSISPIDTSVFLSKTLTDGQIFVGNVSNVATGVAVTGDVLITNAGVTSIATGVIVNADINSAAAIALSKLAATTASRALVSDVSGFITASSVTSTELGYVSGVTSAIQTQINGKQATITGGATTITSSNLTVSRALVSDGSGKVAVATTTSAEIGYVNGVTSSIQTQINGKQASIQFKDEGVDLGSLGAVTAVDFVGTGITATYLSGTVTVSIPGPSGILPAGGTTGQYLNKIDATDYNVQWSTLTLAKVTDVTASVAQVNVLATGYYDATSSVQTQINSKLNNSLGFNSIWRGNSSGLPEQLSAGSNGQALIISGGTPVWSNITATPGGSDTQIQFNDAGAFGGDPSFVWDKTNNVLTVSATRFFTLNKPVDDLFIGVGAGNFTSTGSGANIGIGENSLSALTTGVGNTALGSTAGDDITSGGGNVLINSSGITTGSNNLIIMGSVPSATSDNQMSIKDIIYGTGLAANAGLIGIGTSAPDRRFHVELEDGVSNTVLYAQRLTRTSSVAPALGIGVGMEFEVETSASNNEIGASIEAVTTDVTSTSEDFNLVFKTMASGAAAAERLKINSSGLIVTGDINTTGKVAVSLNDGNTNVVSTGLEIIHNTTGTPANGIGVGIQFETESLGGLKLGSIIESVATDVTSGSEDFDLVFKTMAAGTAAAERLRISDAGISTNSGTSFVKFINGSATLNFPSTGAGTNSDLTITVTGAADGDSVILGVPNGSVVANSCYTAWVSAANTVTVRFNNYDLAIAADPASGTFKVTVIKA